MSTEAKPAAAEETGRPRRDPFMLFLVVACIALAVLVIFLARQNRQLKASLASLAASQVPADALKAGDRVEPFALLGEAGRKDRLEFSPDGSKTLLLVFSTHCPACERALPIWNDFVAAGPPAHLRVVGIETDRPGAAPELGGIVPASLRFPVFSVEQPPPPVMARVPYVPATVLLDGHGRVVKVWFGIPTKEQIGELRDLVSG
jgi:thiol-disulfide isomerase/thioredoxin